VVTPQTSISAEEDKPEIALVAPTATLEDLARVLQTLNLSARDIIAILQALAEQGALKARIRIQ
jgi:flagellar P-ring protein precursor FlgI